MIETPSAPVHSGRQQFSVELMLPSIIKTLLWRGWIFLSRPFRQIQLSKRHSNLGCVTSMLDHRKIADVAFWIAGAPNLSARLLPEADMTGDSLNNHPRDALADTTTCLITSTCEGADTSCEIPRKAEYSRPPFVQFTYSIEDLLALSPESMSIEEFHARAGDVSGIVDDGSDGPYAPVKCSSSTSGTDIRCLACSDNLKYACHDDCDNVTLLMLRRDCRNIVLDSDCPHCSPHIVISPPPHSSDDYYIPSLNRVGPQWVCFLTVPPLSERLFEFMRPPSEYDASASFLPCYDEPPHESETRPLKVFSVARSVRRVRASSTERLIFCHICHALDRHTYKAAALQASALAFSVCERFRLKVKEQSFSWSDPAEPILQACKYWTGCTIIESDSPCSVPHILICEPPPQDPRIGWTNVVNENQDYDYLSVFSNTRSPPRRLRHSTWDDDDEDDSSDCWDSDSASSEMDLSEGLVAYDNDLSFLPCVQGSAAEYFFSEGPEDTETDVWYDLIREGEQVEFPNPFAEEEIHSLKVLPECADSTQPSLLHSLPPLDTSSDEGDLVEDSLPAFDDWYTSILARAEHPHS
ncbi:hypothetical protein HYDPIDRAFT_35409 [Hydnomerulius pinastri MD-312]|nr:hypothetical protein HYDPIDRAFT_35409 [Hydnomerulius pinastri MD-312]